MSSSPSPKVIFICLPGIGDTLMVLPAIRALKKAWPTSHVTALSMLKGAHDVLSISSTVDEALYYPFLSSGIIPSIRYIFTLRKKKFDFAILGYPSNRLEYNVVSLLIGAKSRIGHRYSHRDRTSGNWLNHYSVHENDALNNSEENLRLVELLTGEAAKLENESLVLPSECIKLAELWCAEQILTSGPVIGIHAGGSTAKNHIHKRWPPQYFAQLVRLLHTELDATVLLFGSGSEHELNLQIAEMSKTRAIVVPEQEFLVSAALIGSCAHFIANDSALLHLAGALGVPATGIFGPTNATWVRSLNAYRTICRLQLPCQPCFYYSPRYLTCRYGDFRCLTDLKVEQVFAHISDFFSSKTMAD